MSDNLKNILIRFLPVLIILWCITMFAALSNGWFDCLTFSTCKNDLKGIDFFAVPKSFINLTEGRSAFDTWGGEPWGPYATWYLAHPAFSVFVASWFSFFDPWTSYWLFGIFSLILFAASAWIISRDADTQLAKILPFFFLLCSMLTFAVIYTGNMHAPLVLSLSMILSGIYKLSQGKDEGKKLLLAGLLISFFSKPVVILFSPLLLIAKRTRNTALIGLGIYAVVSFIFLVVPAFNPEGIGLGRTIEIALDPQFVKANLNIYKNNYVLNEYMKDNSIHWLNLIAQSDYYWNHIDIFSLSSFLNTLTGKQLPGILFKLPFYICLVFSFLCFRIKDEKKQMEFAILLISGITMTFFLGYNTVWEYQYALVLPLVAFTPILYKAGILNKTEFLILLVSGICFLLPNLYFLFPKDGTHSHFMITMIRLDRVIPAVIYYLVFILAAARTFQAAQRSTVS